MKINIELVDGLPEDEVTIRCAAITPEVQQLHRLLAAGRGSGPRVVFYKGSQEYYFPLEDILFFETESEQVYAHTETDSYRIKLRLYELEDLLPRPFVRTAKSTIVNTKKIYSIRRDLTGANQISFAGTHKQVYASRRFFAALKQRMAERRNYE